MLNLECQTVYDAIRTLTGNDDVYKVVEAEEIIARLPQEVVLSKVQLSAIIRELKEREYIIVKYFTPDEYCLMANKRIEEKLKQERIATQEEEAPRAVTRVEKKPKEKVTKPVSKSALFFASLLGSLVGSGIIAAITTLIIKFAM